MSAPGIGPYGTEQAARSAAFAVIPPEEGWTILRYPQNVELLRITLRDCGVGHSEWEDRTIRGLGHHEDFAVAVIAGWIRRAHEAGRRAFLRHLLRGEHDYFVLTEALEDFAARQRASAEGSPNAVHRREWADAADRIRGQAEDAMDEPEGGN
jgi:hypothetical protein